ncbi:MAG TPA: pitrilysin family protein [Candidatus Omnitrophota bacterium]|nr:pitrilysin family protein [Candidatus Omnitrophota bacterium]
MIPSSMKFTQKIIAGFFALALWALLSWPALASDDSSSKYVLDNGLTVLVNEMPLSPTVSVYALVKTGSATEGKFLGTGITHFLEHMLFKGTHEGGVGELASRIQSVGGSINASTGMDYTVYTVTVPRESFQVALAVVADMMQHAAMDPEEVERERNVIFSEMRMRDDDPGSKLSALTFQSVYLEHPYRHPIIGYKSLLEQVTRGFAGILSQPLCAQQYDPVDSRGYQVFRRAFAGERGPRGI